MGLVISRANVAGLKEVLQSSSVAYLLFIIVVIFLQIFFFAYRWTLLASPFADITIKNAYKLILATCTLNLFLPSKLGDFAKAYSLVQKNAIEIKRSVNVVLFERGLDVLSLSFIASVALLIQKDIPFNRLYLSSFWGVIIIGVIVFACIPISIWSKWEDKKYVSAICRLMADAKSYIGELLDRPVVLFQIIICSLFLWVVQVSQLFLIFKALHTVLSASLLFARIPVAIFAGLMPVSLSGIGVRDAAYLYLFKGLENPDLLIAAGLLTTCRYIIPALAGIPFLKSIHHRAAV